jgi:hypothetical protein
MRAALWQGDARRGTPPNSAPLSTARLSACLLKEGLFRDSGRRSAIASGGLSLGHLGLGLAKYRCADQETARTTNFDRVQNFDSRSGSRLVGLEVQILSRVSLELKQLNGLHHIWKACDSRFGDQTSVSANQVIAPVHFTLRAPRWPRGALQQNSVSRRVISIAST